MDNDDVEIELQQVDDDFADNIPTKDQNMEEGELSDDNNEVSVRKLEVLNCQILCRLLIFQKRILGLSTTEKELSRSSRTKSWKLEGF